MLDAERVHMSSSVCEYDGEASTLGAGVSGQTDQFTKKHSTQLISFLSRRNLLLCSRVAEYCGLHFICPLSNIQCCWTLFSLEHFLLFYTLLLWRPWLHPFWFPFSLDVSSVSFIRASCSLHLWNVIPHQVTIFGSFFLIPYALPHSSHLSPWLQHTLSNSSVHPPRSESTNWIIYLTS